MKEYESKHGFSVTSVERVDDIDATVVEMIHEKSGAGLIYLDRRDDNTTFCIGFKTIPTDDTGVFHILEHSVLCGSEKFPIKDPFNEMIKSSHSTYLNALTSGDKTLYPISSKNPKSFMGLADVYLDAVFNPIAMKNPYIFMQEGHRYELDEDGDLIITGVVYNEMQGVFSTPDDYADYIISKRLRPGGTYSYESGGYPDLIPELTYEQFKSTYEKFYHPSNAIIFLDGDVDLDAMLSLIDSYLCKYERRDAKFAVDEGGDILTDVYHGTYPIDEDEDIKDKSRLFISYNSFPHDDLRNTALSVVTEVLSDLSSSPLTKRIIDTGLCESVAFYNTSGYHLNSLHTTFIGVKDGKEEELIHKFDEALREILEEGVCKDSILSFIKRREFKIREADSGSYPKGMVYMRACISSAMFGEPVAEGLRYSKTFAELYERLETDYFTDTLREVLASDRITVVLHPDPEFNEKKEERLCERLDAIAAAMTEEEKAQLIATLEDFRKWQSEPETPEALATIPRLCLSDMNPDIKPTPTETAEACGVTVVMHPLHTGGISYAQLYFDVSDADEDEIHYLRLLCDMNYEWDTGKSTSVEFRNKVIRHLGSFYLGIYPIKTKNGNKLFLRINLTCLDSEKENALKILDEYLTDIRYDNREVMKNDAKQFYTSSVDSICAGAGGVIYNRGAARYDAYQTMHEHISGYENHLFTKHLAQTVDSTVDEVLVRLSKLHEKCFRRERLTVGITEPDGFDFAKRIIETVPAGGEPSGESPIKPLEAINEAIVVPGSVSYCAWTTDFGYLGRELYTGEAVLYNAIVTNELMWNEIRVKNGAYGTDYIMNATGSISATSARDPSPVATLEYCARISEKMDEFLDTSPSLDKHIIGVFGSMDSITTPRTLGATATARYFSGLTHEEVLERRYAILNATADSLRRINDINARAAERATFTVAGPRDEIEKIPGVQRVLEI